MLPASGAAMPVELAQEAERAAVLPAPLRDVAIHILVLKSVFAGASFRAFAAGQADAGVRAVLLKAAQETREEAAGALAALEDWARFRLDEALVARAAETTRARLLGDLLRLKEVSTEAALAAAAHAPTEALRRELVRLADLDRKHADEMRPLLGARTIEECVQREVPASEPLGAHAGREPGSSLAKSIENALTRLRRAGEDAARIVVSGNALRHLRDEGAIDARHGTAFGLPVDVDFGWSDECFAFVTKGRVSLAEIITSMRG